MAGAVQRNARFEIVVLVNERSAQRRVRTCYTVPPTCRMSDEAVLRRCTERIVRGQTATPSRLPCGATGPPRTRPPLITTELTLVNLTVPIVTAMHNGPLLRTFICALNG